MSRIIGLVGVALIIVLVIFYVRDVFNFDPLFMGKTQEVTGYVLDNKVAPIGRGVTYELIYQYTVDGNIFQDSYYSNDPISNLETGDSLKLQVSLKQPSKNKVVGYY